MSNPTEGFRHVTPVEVRFHDLDAFGHVNNARYLNYLEQGRLAYYRDVMGWDGKLKTLTVIVANVTIDFKLPIFLGDTLNLHTRVSRLGNTSFDQAFVFMVTHEGNSPQVAALAKVVMVTYDYEQNKPVPILPLWREAIQAYEPGL